MTLDKLKKIQPPAQGIYDPFARKIYKRQPTECLKYASRYYSDDDHGSVPLASEYDGLRFIFDYYRLKTEC